MKVYLETLGCQMNRLDSELLVGLLKSAGHEVCPTRRNAEAVLYNTCSVREHAEQKVFSRLGADAKRKSAGKKLVVGVLGCLSQRMGRELAKRYPAVDFVVAPGQLFRVPELLERAANARKRAFALDPSRKTRPDAEALQARRQMELLDLGRDVGATTSAASTFVRIMRGCDKFCTYCVVPFVRGPEHSRPPGEIREEVRRLLDAGRSEITLLGQTVNSYRHTQGDRTTTFADLLALLSPLAGLRRLRFVTSYPVDFQRETLEAMRDLPNVCEYLHIPAQSGSDRVLSAMNRHYSREEYDRLIDAARQIVPGVVFAGDFIVGFPGESEEDHAASAELIRRTGYKNSFVFKYSPRPGTPAERKLPDDVPEAVKRRRNNELLAVQQEVGRAHHEQYVGREMEVLVTGKSRRSDKQPAPPAAGEVQLMGRTRGDHIVIFDGPENLVDTYAAIRITSASALGLFGERMNEG